MSDAADAGTTPAFDGVVVVDAGADAVVGGLSLLERAVFALARAGAGRVLCVGRRPAPALRFPPVPLAWCAPGDPAALAAWSAAAAPVVGIAATTVIDGVALAALAGGDDAPCAAAAAVAWRAPAPAVAPLVAASTGAAWPPPSVPPWSPPAGALCVRADSAVARRAAEAALYARLGRPGDGWVTRNVDRRLSRLLTRGFVAFGVTPNVVTLVSMAIGMSGGVAIATGDPALGLLGALLFLFSTVVDGCDGELARLTYRESVFGARLDLVGDNLVHLVLFGGIATGLYGRTNSTRVAILGSALVAGVLLAMGTAYAVLVWRTPTPAQRALFDTFGSREFAYLLVVLAAIGRLEWFLWMSAVGTYAFVAGLLLLGRRST